MKLIKVYGTIVFLFLGVFASVTSAEILIARDKQIEFTIPANFEKQRLSSSQCIEYKLTLKSGSVVVREISFNYWDNVFYFTEEKFMENLERARNPKTISSKNIQWSDPIFKKSKFGSDRNMIEIHQQCNYFGKNRFYVWFVIEAMAGVPIHKDNIAIICWASDLENMDTTINFFKECATQNLKINN